jgi:small subunit ribosomal protein S9
MAKQVADIFVGRRKEATARVFLLPVAAGKAPEVLINGRTIDQYFANPLHRDDVMRPFRVTSTEGNFNVRANVSGGGLSGQAGAVRLGIARALVDTNAELRPALRGDELLTRDPRMVERKKYGQPKARKRFQFSKR